MDTIGSMLMEIHSRLSHWSFSFEIKGSSPTNYEELPEALGSYLRSRVYKDASSTQTLTASGLTFVQAILKMVQVNGRKAQALDNYPSLINDPEICRLRLEVARDTKRKHFEETVSKRHLVAFADDKYGPVSDWSYNRFLTHLGIETRRRVTRG